MNFLLDVFNVYDVWYLMTALAKSYPKRFCVRRERRLPSWVILDLVNPIKNHIKFTDVPKKIMVFLKFWILLITKTSQGYLLIRSRFLKVILWNLEIQSGGDINEFRITKQLTSSIWWYGNLINQVDYLILELFYSKRN